MAKKSSAQTVGKRDDGTPVWKLSRGAYHLVTTGRRTPEELLHECQSTIVGLIVAHPGLDGLVGNSTDAD